MTAVHDEPESIKRKKLELYMQRVQEQASQHQVEEAQASQQIAALETMIKTRLTRDALQRYGNIKAAHPEKAVQLLVVLGRLINTGRAGIIGDDDLKSLLRMMSEEEGRTTRIVRK